MVTASWFVLVFQLAASPRIMLISSCKYLLERVERCRFTLQLNLEYGGKKEEYNKNKLICGVWYSST